MGIKIPKGAYFLGVPLITVRNVLKAWRYGGSTDAAQIASLSHIGLDARTVIVLLDELRDRGLIGEEMGDGNRVRDGLTEKGLALVIASARARTPKKAAWKKFDEFLASCAAINTRAELPFYVKEVWLFGSMIDSARMDVGDIDFVIETDRRANASKSSETYERLAKELGINTSSYDVFRMPRFAVEKYLLYGPRQHPLLKPSPLKDLVALACPCQLVFTEANGRSLGPIFDKHPIATDKHDTVRGRFVLGDLFGKAKDLRPLPADLVHPRSLALDYRLSKTVGPWPVDDDRYRFVLDKIHQCHPLISDAVPHDIVPNVITKRLEIGHCDLRKKSGLIVTETLYIEPNTSKSVPDWRARIKDNNFYFSWKAIERATYATVVERSIEEHRERVMYSVSILSEISKGSTLNYDDFCAAHYWFHLLATADLEHILRRDAENGVTRRIVLSTSNSEGIAVTRQEDATNDLALELAYSLSEFLRQANSRKVDMEPR